MFRPGDNPKNNCVVYSKYYYISSYNQYKPMDILQCPDEAKYLIKDKKSCIDECKNKILILKKKKMENGKIQIKEKEKLDLKKKKKMKKVK